MSSIFFVFFRILFYRHRRFRQNRFPVFQRVKEDSHAWFTGFAPAEDPKVSVTIIVEGAGSGGDYAVPIAKRLFDVYFEQYMSE